jgi:hypothetical protein
LIVFALNAEQNFKLMNKETVNELLKKAKFKFALSMPNIPHEYSHREKWEVDKDFCDVVQFIRDNGVKEKFFKKTFIYYYLDQYKYWTMGNELSYTNRKKTFILNRAKI